MPSSEVNHALLERIFGSEGMKGLLGTFSWVLQLLYALVCLGAFVALIVNITKLGASDGNPGKRSEALHNILVSGVCLAIMGGLGVIVLLLVGFLG